ncbi:hypothetical protein [Geobacter sp. AOG2]|nr:hypothetical protein [Geobacter sp. AOG2]GFE59418.1 hypothetical protein AOG2_00060 [Geobacter sp. AOG2]
MREENIKLDMQLNILDKQDRLSDLPHALSFAYGQSLVFKKRLMTGNTL